MRWVFAFIVVVHGLIHLMGPAKAFGYAELPQLTQPISRGMGLVWLLAAAPLRLPRSRRCSPGRAAGG